jgi:hypothetical protein
MPVGSTRADEVLLRQAGGGELRTRIGTRTSHPAPWRRAARGRRGRVFEFESSGREVLHGAAQVRTGEPRREVASVSSISTMIGAVPGGKFMSKKNSLKVIDAMTDMSNSTVGKWMPMPPEIDLDAIAAKRGIRRRRPGACCRR